MRSQKIYFKLIKENWWWGIDFHWVSDRWEILRLSWNPKFLLRALVDLYWLEEAKILEEKLMKAFQHIDTYTITHSSKKPWSFVLYTGYNKRHDDKSSDMRQDIQEDEGGKDGIGWEGKEDMKKDLW